MRDDVASQMRSEGGSVLFVGDPNRAFLDARSLRKGQWVILSNVLDAIDLAARGKVRAVGVVMSGTSEKLSAALVALREATDAPIVLLAQMYEEPIAKRFVGWAPNGQKVADDYVICPTSLARFFESIDPAAGAPQGRAGSPDVLDAEIERRMRLLEKLATEDDLTELKNRRYILEFFRQVLEHAKTEHGRVTLLIFDIDDFKHYNDVYGHAAGDEILRQAALLMRRCCRAHDVVGRIGGDEFAVVFWDDAQKPNGGSEKERRRAAADHPSEAVFIANRFRTELEKAELHPLGPKGEGTLTISGGLASFPRDGSTVGGLFAQADQALLDAKRSGKNRIYLVGQPNGDIADSPGLEAD